ncbi:hypothetical protein M413DRAFT_187510 [Hebeloma cylindrosporum]|uniref:F-box domain-containing protein n=1 Tax=Hebeloma cylindrosporum TaxID=76867 RepID=A0A0C3BTB8_HEBCY|nr:hypothetical protein M413DRAFT_187510 [Hebeloma cylindrosporum h7]
MVNFPPEIWLNVALFVCDNELRNLLGVNSVFFDIAINLRWKDVDLMTRNTSQAMHVLSRLSDPFIGNRLRSLTLRLTHVKQRSPRLDNANVGHPHQQFYSTFRRVFKVLRRDTQGPGSSVSSSPKFSEVMDALIACSPNFCNIQQLRIDSWDLPPSYDIQPLFKSFWSSFGSNLHQLSLGGNLEGYKLLIETDPILPSLIDLQVEFTNNVFRVDQDTDAATLVDIVAPFINRLSHHIKFLKKWSWAALDLSDFFLRLTAFPRVERLSVRMAFNIAFQQNASGLKTLLSASSGSLQRLDLRLNPSGWPINPIREESLGQWLSSCVADDKCFSHLHALDIYPTIIPVSLDVLLTFIERSSSTLKELLVRDRYLQQTEARNVIDAASQCPNLVSLRFNLMRLDIGLLDHLARKLPNLTHLWIALEEVLSNREVGGLGHAFFEDLKGRSYPHWKLRDISIWQGGQEIEHDAMLAFARNIPSVTSLFLRGHMRSL